MHFTFELGPVALVLTIRVAEIVSIACLCYTFYVVSDDVVIDLFGTSSSDWPTSQLFHSCVPLLPIRNRICFTGALQRA